MKKSKHRARAARKSASSTQKTTTTTAAAATGGVTRRDLLGHLRDGSIATLVVGGGAWWAVSAVRTTAEEQDLSRIGQGKPTIVQVHDPQCVSCTELQRQARRALSCFGECDVVYLVANIRSDTGRAFAARHRVPHVTLMLFDGQGALRQTLTGVRRSAELKPVFTTHLQST